jgi:hypothetical protein
MFSMSLKRRRRALGVTIGPPGVATGGVGVPTVPGGAGETTGPVGVGVTTMGGGCVITGGGRTVTGDTVIAESVASSWWMFIASCETTGMHAATVGD